MNPPPGRGARATASRGAVHTGDKGESIAALQVEGCLPPLVRSSSPVCRTEDRNSRD